MTVASWSTSDMQTLWINVTVLLRLMHPTVKGLLSFSAAGVSGGKPVVPRRFTIPGEGQRPWEVEYSTAQSRRLGVFACVAAGTESCPEAQVAGRRPVSSENVGGGASPFPPTPRRGRSDTTEHFDPLAEQIAAEHLGRLAEQVTAARRRGERNFVLRRGALLHADIGMTDRPATRPPGARGSPGPHQLRIHIFDGRETDQDEVAIHWVIGRQLLDAVTPAPASKGGVGGDAMVRQWYGATAAWMQNHEQYDALHFAHARALFPDDPDILFLSGCQHEVIASPRLHSALERAVIPRSFSIEVGSVNDELRFAETFFRRAINAKPDMVEAHLHLGHVLLLRKEYQDAADHLRRAAPLGRMDDEVLEYSRSLFLGAAEEMLGRSDAAREAFERASALQPSAQSPLLALSELARRRGDYDAALSDLHRVFALPPSEPERSDPWWTYYVAHVRDDQELLARLRAPFLVATR